MEVCVMNIDNNKGSTILIECRMLFNQYNIRESFTCTDYQYE